MKLLLFKFLHYYIIRIEYPELGREVPYNFLPFKRKKRGEKLKLRKAGGATQRKKTEVSAKYGFGRD